MNSNLSLFISTVTSMAFNLTNETLVMNRSSTIPFEYKIWQKILFGSFIVPVIIFSIIGNVFVIIAIAKYQQLQITGNIFLASLAVADCAIGILVMPMNALQVLTGRWYLKAVACRLWFSLDVLFSTASILHLFCISVDRYLSISNFFSFKYLKEDSTSWRIRLMIGSVWFISALLSFIPIFTNLFTTPEHALAIDRLDYAVGVCEFLVNIYYRIVSSCISFWLPGIGMVVFYGLVMRKALRFAKKDIRLRRMSSISVPPARPLSKMQSDPNEAQEFLNSQRNKRRNTTFSERWNKEYRALKTFGTVITVFLLCWIFFFINYTFCNDVSLTCTKYIDYETYVFIVDILFWIGYFNSMINPFLYNFTNQDFRKVFRKMLGINHNDDTHLFHKIFCFCKKKNNTAAVAYRKRSSPGLNLHESHNL